MLTILATAAVIALGGTVGWRLAGWFESKPYAAQLTFLACAITLALIGVLS